MQNDHRDLAALIPMYKTATTDKEKNEIFFSIRGHLIHHLNAVISILKGTTYDGNRQVYEVIRKGFAVSSRGDVWDAMSRLQTLCQQYTEEDIMQELSLILLHIINKYTHSKIPFHKYITYLLPRRVLSWLWRVSKDISNQFSTEHVSSYEDQSLDGYEATIVQYMCTNSNYPYVQDTLTFVEEDKFEMLCEYIEGCDTNKLAEENRISIVCLKDFLEATQRQIGMAMKSLARKETICTNSLN